MGLSYYGFAFFIFLLLCAFALLCKQLFARSRGHMQALDEKEKKLLALYSTLEDMMDEFNDTALAANTELARHIAELREAAASLRVKPAPPAARPAPANVPAAPPGGVPPGATRRANPGEETKPAAPVTQTVTAAVTPSFTPLNPPEITAGGPERPAERQADRPARILALHKQGMDRVHIAKELSVTLSEVDLVLGIAAQKK